MLLRTAIAFFVLPGLLGAQASLRDPLAAPAAADTNEATARAIRAADLMRKGETVFLRADLDGTPFVFIRGWTAGGTGAGQVSYLIYQVVREDSVRLVFRAPQWEYTAPNRGMHIRAQDFHACLFIDSTGAVVYLPLSPSRSRTFDNPPLPAAGIYRWDAARVGFVRRGVAPAAASRKCREGS